MILTFIFIIISFSTSVFATTPYYTKDNLFRKKAIQEVMEEFIEPYKSEETPENERIKDYYLSGWGSSYEDDNVLKVAITFLVTPYSEENTIWETEINNYCYATFKKENGGYILENITQGVENLDKFLAKFEEYKKEHPDFEKEKIDIQEIEGKEEKLYNSNTYRTISIGVYIASAVLFIIGIILIKIKSRS